MMSSKNVGIVAGVGPLAGVDLMRKIIDQTIAQCDQEHLTVLSISQPAKILDRTQFLLGQIKINPATAFVEQLLKLEAMGAFVAGIPCNTAHAPLIFDLICEELAKAQSHLKLLNMIEETAVYLQTYHPQIQHIGILSTTGTYKTEIYPEALATKGFTAIVPEFSFQEEVVHTAVYHTHYGIKTCGTVTPTAQQNLLNGIEHLQQQGAQAIILGCTEMPLAITEKQINNSIIIDPTLILARALIREAAPEKLKPINNTK